jgi:alcohol dehydrogenase class IV
VATHANWSYPTAIKFGAGRIEELPEHCPAAGISCPLVVTDKGLAGQGFVQRALASLGPRAKLFSDVRPNPSEANLAAGLEAFRSGRHDGVVAIGGGSALDLGKLIAFMSGQTRPVWEFEDIGDWWTRADENGIAPSVAVPTTAGTGSEVGRAGVLTQEATHTKKVIFHPKILPRVVIADPAVTVGMPNTITAGTGMDAFAHCLEAYCAPSFHPMSAGIALEGMRLVKENLPGVYAQPDDIEKRGNMMTAAMMGAVAFQKGLGAIHALSHPVGALYDTHHGTTNAVVMDTVLRFNRPAIEEKIERLARYLGIYGGFDGFLSFANTLRASLGIPERLGVFGVKKDRLDELAAMAIEDPTASGNPVPLDLAAARALYEQCI